MTSTSERGFTLVEVLVAMVIVTIALVSLAELMAITLRMQLLGRNQTAAVRLVQSKIDQLVAVGFTTNGSPTAIVAPGGSLSSDSSGYNDDPEDGFHRRWVISAITGETRIRTLTVKVSPTRVDRRTGDEVQLTTIIRDP